jgi:hypothetical protein
MLRLVDVLCPCNFSHVRVNPEQCWEKQKQSNPTNIHESLLFMCILACTGRSPSQGEPLAPSSSRRQPPGVAREERRLPDVAEAAEEHHHPLQPHAEPFVRRRAVPERVDVGGDGTDVDAPCLRLRRQELRVVHPLRPGDDLLAADEDVEGAAVARFVGAGHGVERPHRRRVPAEHVELRVVPVENTRSNQSLILPRSSTPC